MAPENNSNANQDSTASDNGVNQPTPDTNVSPGATVTPSQAPTTSVPTVETPTASETTTPASTEPTSSPSPVVDPKPPETSTASSEFVTPVSQMVEEATASANQTEANKLPTIPETNSDNPAASVSAKAPKKSKFGLKLFVVILALLALNAGTSTATYYYGKSQKRATPAVTVQPINLPREAIVTSDCTPGRGKQYIIPKDIPVGPIYDVKNSKVIAIEYVLGMRALLSNSDSFSTTLLSLSKNYPVDHFSVVPEQPKANDTDQYIHLIMFVVPKAEANSITCSGTSTTPSASSTTPPATTTKKQ